MSRSDPTSSATSAVPVRQFRTLPHEGEGGVFTQTWLAVCRSVDVPIAGVIGRSFLDGRVVVYRGVDGVAQVMSAYCPHVGADLALGTVTGQSLRCAFHHWEYDRDGYCTRTGIGDPAPPTACLFRFPTIERYGVIWAFNGYEPLFDLAEPSRPVAQLELQVNPSMQLTTDPWIVCANTPDWAHFATVHRFDFPRDGQNESLSFEAYGVRRRFSARLEHGEGPQVSYMVTVRGTSQVLIEGVSEGHWFGVMACMGVPRPGLCDFFVVAMIDRSEYDSPAAAATALENWSAVASRMGAEDAPIWATIRFKQGALTRADAALAQYLEQLRSYPRAHPSADFIN